MDAYYKERKKQLETYSKKIKKLAITDQVDELKRVKKEYLQLLSTPPSFKRDAYMTEYEYIKTLNKRLRETENKFIELKLDLCYDLHQDMKEYDQQDKDVSILRKNRDSLVLKKRERELIEGKKNSQKQELLKGTMESYFFLENEDKKTTYKEIEKLSADMSNKSRKVISYEIEHNELEYRLTQLYEPLNTIKITI